MAIDPRQMILQMMMQQGGGMPQEGAPPDQMANMMRNIDPTTPRQRGSESGGGGGGGAPWGRSRPPMSAPPAMGPSMPPQGGPQGVPAHPYEGMSQGYPEQELMDDVSGGLPPEIMQLASLGIGPRDLMGAQGDPRRMREMPHVGMEDDEAANAVSESRRNMLRNGPQMHKPGTTDADFDEHEAPDGDGGSPTDVPNRRGRRLDRSNDPEDVDPMESYGAPGDEKDPRFGPEDDPLRDQTENELADVRQNMGRREISEIAEEIRSAINDNDQATYKSLMDELEETGIDPDELPPDIQKMMEENDADDDERGSTEPVQDA